MYRSSRVEHTVSVTGHTDREARVQTTMLVRFIRVILVAVCPVCLLFVPVQSAIEIWLPPVSFYRYNVQYGYRYVPVHNACIVHRGATVLYELRIAASNNQNSRSCVSAEEAWATAWRPWSLRLRWLAMRSVKRNARGCGPRSSECSGRRTRTAMAASPSSS